MKKPQTFARGHFPVMCFEILALYKDRERPVGFLFIPAFRNLSNL